ncbi:thiamine phosphate synthase [Bartonella raoultii]|uniref:Thiamine phosphate synthase n=1 Tax=Bartonella raoultii TaxID=1457020 RepID=A0ABS7I4T6_9HYPH|nr:thiamine phosphate synthase [Bartonella raoultii]MBX4335838.1 thiamine phosphate synthase [Bartonella raoultii]
MKREQNKAMDSPLFPQLVLTLDVRRSFSPHFLRPILQTQFFVCVIIYDSQGLKDDASFLQKQAQQFVEEIQKNGAALVIAGDSRIVGRTKADGLHIEGDLNMLEHLKNEKKEQKIIGFGNIRNRHCAMVAAETGIDYLLFGKLGADKKPNAHPRNLQLSEWWAKIMEIPAIVQAGSDIANFEEVLKTGSEFIAVEEMLFGNENPLPLLKMMHEKCKNAPL